MLRCFRLFWSTPLAVSLSICLSVHLSVYLSFLSPDMSREYHIAMRRIRD